MVLAVSGLSIMAGSGCARAKVVTQTPTPARPMSQTIHDWVAQGAGKTAVFCLNGDPQTQRRLETQIVTVMKSRGFDAWPGRDQIPPAEHYSANDVAVLLKKAGFTSIADVTYSGPIPSDGFPQQLSFNVHALTAPRRVSYSTMPTGLNAAINLLFAAVLEQQAL